MTRARDKYDGIVDERNGKGSGDKWDRKEEKGRRQSDARENEKISTTGLEIIKRRNKGEINESGTIKFRN